MLCLCSGPLFEFSSVAGVASIEDVIVPVVKTGVGTGFGRVSIGPGKAGRRNGAAGVPEVSGKRGESHAEGGHLHGVSSVYAHMLSSQGVLTACCLLARTAPLLAIVPLRFSAAVIHGCVEEPNG